MNHPTTKMDSWAIGIILHELCSQGQHPFDNDTLKACTKAPKPLDSRIP